MARTNSPNGSEPEIFDARKAVAEAEREYPPFPFIGLDGAQYLLPHPFLLNAGQQQAVIQAQAEGSDEDIDQAMRHLLTEVAPDALAALDQMPQVVVMRIMLAWQEKAVQELGETDGEQLGNSPRRSSPPNRAARRSRPTSQPKGSTSTSSPSTR